MKVLITGATGLLGREIKAVFDSVSSWDVLGIGYNRIAGNLKKVDLRKSSEIVDLINEFQPDVVIHSAAERNYGAVAKNVKETHQLNVEATETIAKSVNKYGGYVLYISTNLVFDGKNAPYKITDAPKPANDYGITKLHGEQAISKYCTASGILRLPLLFGKVENLKESGVSNLLAILQDSSKKAVVSNYEYKYPTNTYDVAMVCKQIIECYEVSKNFNGVWHWCTNERFTKYEMVKTMSSLFQLPMTHIEPSDGPVGRHYQPFDCGLDSSALEKLGIGYRTPFEDTLRQSLQHSVEHKSDT